MGLLRGFVSLKFKNPQTHIFKLRGFVGLWVCGFVGLWVCGFVGLWVCGFRFQINVSLWVCGYVGFNLVCGFVGFSFSCEMVTYEGGGLFGHQFRQNFRKIDSPGGLLQLFLEKLNI